jgi:hypothetical protein
MALTVAKLAERALSASPGSDAAVVIRQIRHWTLSGVVRPTTDVHTGVGKHRQYAESEAYFAALALELTRWRIPVGVLDGVVQAARREFEGNVNPTREPIAGVKDAIDGEDGVFLFVKFSDGVDSHRLEVKLGPYLKMSRDIADSGWTRDMPSFLAIDLSALFRKVRRI